MEFILNEDRIDFIWTANTRDMNDAEFQFCILRYASFAMEYKIKNVLIDLTDFKFKPAEESGQFHSDYDNAFMKTYDEAANWLNS